MTLQYSSASGFLKAAELSESEESASVSVCTLGVIIEMDGSACSQQSIANLHSHIPTLI